MEHWYPPVDAPRQGRGSSASFKSELENRAEREGDEAGFLERCGELAKVVFTPPVIAVILGAVVGIVKPLRNLLVDYNDFDNDMPLQWGFNAVTSFGQAAVPLNMMILGAALANIPSFSSIHWPSTLLTAFCKLVVCPAVAFCVVGSVVMTGLLQKFVPNTSLHTPFVLVACLVAATPTANNLTVMAEAYAGADSKEALSSSIFVMYCFAPLTLTAWIVAFCALGQYV